MATPNRASSYDLEEWAADTSLGRRIFNYNYRMTGTEIRGWELVNTVEMPHEPGLTERIYIWERKGSGGKALIRIGITETNEWRRAQSELQAQLYHSMRPEIPRGEGKLARVGDIAFVGRPQEARTAAALFFSRGNITVAVASAGEEIVDVAAVAQNIDRTFTEPPQQADIEAQRAEKRAPKPLQMKKGEPVRVIDRLPEPVLRQGWLKVIAPDGELAREGDALIYISPDAGPKEVEEFVVVQE